MGEPRKSVWQALFRSTAFFVVNIAVLLLVGVSTLRESYRGWSVDREIHALEAQADTLEGRKMELQQLAESLQSPERAEVEARRRLGWQKPGERVVITGETVAPTADDAIPSVALASDRVQTPTNPERWFDYFFHSSP